MNASKAEDSYVFGGAKLFNYGIKSSDLQVINTSLISLGFSSSLSSTDNSGIGFDLGVGFNVADNFAIEVGYVDYGTLEINTTLTGPSETLKTEINGNGVTGAGVLKFGDAQENFYLKGGMHRWDFEGTVTASLGSSTEPLGTGTDIMIGAGFNMGNWYASYDFYYIDDGDISSLGLGYRKPF
tara:strand:+ start:231 stop:779 length:549 start_codon:yes stop_codon:yes gene_type:complete